ncbi:hypothetical protein K7432_005789 [Basidiobolus ranarum]|uniref:Uncharacterized protein n=1 Tax=Basidiobolus ranarum TaxID=34480 RepID=A0ABR2W2K7_9FUNG
MASIFSFLVIIYLIKSVHGIGFPYCQGQYAVNAPNCGQFDFRRIPTATCAPIPIQQVENSASELPESIRRLILSITNVFENFQVSLDYPFCRNIKDGLGFTCGYAGFTTANGDALMVIEEYLRMLNNTVTDGPFGKYISELRHLADPNDCISVKGDVSKLRGFPIAWRQASCDPLFRRAQDRVGHRRYIVPAMNLAWEVGIRSNLGKAIFYDTAVQHGHDVDDGISLRTLIKMTGSLNITEAEYLDRFLKLRRKMLCCFPNTVWPATADRISDFTNLLQSGNLQLSTPVRLISYQHQLTGQERLDTTCISDSTSFRDNIYSFKALIMVWAIWDFLRL